MELTDQEKRFIVHELTTTRRNVDYQESVTINAIIASIVKKLLGTEPSPKTPSD